MSALSLEDRIREVFVRTFDSVILEMEDLLKADYDTLFNEIMSADSIEDLVMLSEVVRFNENLSDVERTVLWDEIDRMLNLLRRE